MVSLLRLKKFCLTRWFLSFAWVFFSINSGNELFNSLLRCSWRRILDSNFIGSYMCSNSLIENNLFLHRSWLILCNLLAENSKRKILLCHQSNSWWSCLLATPYSRIPYCTNGWTWTLYNRTSLCLLRKFLYWKMAAVNELIRLTTFPMGDLKLSLLSMYTPKCLKLSKNLMFQSGFFFSCLIKSPEIIVSHLSLFFTNLFDSIQTDIFSIVSLILSSTFS